jgi:hypothetical protein
MTFLTMIDGKGQPVFTKERKKAYIVEGRSNAYMICRLLSMVFKKHHFDVETEEPGGETGMYIITSLNNMVRVTYFRNLNIFRRMSRPR